MNSKDEKVIREKLVPLTATISSLQKLAEQTFTLQYFLEGEAGLARWMHESLKDAQGRSMYICTDVSKLTMMYINQTGKICVDTKGKLLTSLIMSAISNHITTLYTNYVEQVKSFIPSQSMLEQHLKQLKSEQHLGEAKKIYSKLKSTSQPETLRLYCSLNLI